MPLSLPSVVYTPQLLEAVGFEVEQLRDWLSDSAVRSKVGTSPAAEPSRLPETQLVIDSWLDGKEPSVTQLTALAKELQGMKPVTVHLTLAAMPGESLRLKLVEWFRSTCRNDVLVAFTADRTIGGGIIIRTPNRIFDYSFKERLIEGRNNLPEIIRHVG